MYTNCDLILSVKEAEDHEKWLAVRNQGIGGSDASVIMGLNPYKSAYQLWLEKRGVAEPEDLTGNPYIYWGAEKRGEYCQLVSGGNREKDSAARNTSKQRKAILACQCRQNGYRGRCGIGNQNSRCFPV